MNEHGLTADETIELWLSESCSMAFVRMGDARGGPERVLFVHIVQHEISPLRLLYARPSAAPEDETRCEVYQFGTRAVVAEQDGEHLQLLIASNASQHRSMRFHRIDPTGSHAAYQLLRFLEHLAPRPGHGERARPRSR